MEPVNIPHTLYNVGGLRTGRDVGLTWITLGGILVRCHGNVGGGGVAWRPFFPDTLKCSTKPNIVQRPQIVHVQKPIMFEGAPHMFHADP